MTVASVINYGEDPLQTIKFFHFDKNNKHTLIFIHGGAWRDPNHTYDDFKELINQLPTDNTNYIGLNYRLSPEVKHPSHLVDVVHAISFLEKEHGIHNALLVGHSVGATLILQLLMYQTLLGQSLDINPPTIKLDSLFFIDGIYDIADLVDEYPDYILFVNEAFASEDDYVEAVPLAGKFRRTPFELEFKKAHILQSLEDELLSERQLDIFALFLQEKEVPFTDSRGNWGKHEEVYRRKEIAEIICLDLSN